MESKPVVPSDPSKRAVSGNGLQRHHYIRIALLTILGVLCVYWAVSYQALPAIWHSYERHHPAMERAQRRAFTAQGIPGDPLNFAFVGSQDELVRAALAAGWLPADPITWGTSTKIALDAMIHRAYPDAPVSDLFVWGKKQDMAFEQPYGPDPRKRHHVRFWRSEELDGQGRPLWLGAATFDSRVGVSHLTGQVTHHIDADVDKERDKLAADLSQDSSLALEWMDGFQLENRGKNGGGDPYFTDGRLCVARIASQDTALDTAARFFAPVLDLFAGPSTSH